MLDGSVSPDCTVVVLSVKFGKVDGGLLDDSEDGPVVLLNAGVIMELNQMFLGRLGVMVDVSGTDGGGIGKDPLVADGKSTSNVLHYLGIVKADHQVDHIGIASIFADIVAFP